MSTIKRAVKYTFNNATTTTEWNGKQTPGVVASKVFCGLILTIPVIIFFVYLALKLGGSQ